MDMLGAMLENDVSKLEQLIVDNMNHVNDPIGLPFETPSSRFFGHPAMHQMMILQHPDQTLLDIACGMPCGPIIWILLSHGAKGSRHPLGTDLALHNAIKNGRPYTVQAMLVPGRSDVNGTLASTWKPLLQAVFWNHPEVVRILIRRGAHIENVGPSPSGIGSNTALQLCLERRAADYAIEPLRERHNQSLKMLLDAGANIHVGPTQSTLQPPFDSFIKSWNEDPIWGTRLSVLERDCLRMFVSQGANLQTFFKGCPCGPMGFHNFAHQVLWHSTPSIARLVIDSFISSSHNDGSNLLHEILGNCTEAKRHPVDTLRDIRVLLQQGVDPNLSDDKGVTPLRKCLECCPAVDLSLRLQTLLEAGANPEAVDQDGVPSYVFAARTFEEPLLSEVMQMLVTHIGGRYTNTTDGVSHTWSSAHFPIAEDQTYEQVISSSRSTGDFRTEMKDMVPQDVQAIFSQAYFAVVSANFLDTVTRKAKSRLLTARDKDEVSWILGMRTGIDLPDYKFDQELVIALLHPQPILDMDIEASIENVATNKPNNILENATDSLSPNPQPTLPQPASTSPPHAPWTFNPHHTASPPPQPLLSLTSQSPTSSASDLFFASTTQIRWKDPTAKTKPGDMEKAMAAVLLYKCRVCNDGTLLTKKEEQKHEMEHEHSSACDSAGCGRRFCMQRRRECEGNRGGGRDGIVNQGCQDHLFGGDFELIAAPGQATLASALTSCLEIP
jgi:ankyrin repeat protein